MHEFGGTHLDHSGIQFTFQLPVFHIFWKNMFTFSMGLYPFQHKWQCHQLILMSYGLVNLQLFTVLLDAFKFLSTLVNVQRSCFNQLVLHGSEPVVFQGNVEVCLPGPAYPGWAWMDSSVALEWTPLHIQGS